MDQNVLAVSLHDFLELEASEELSLSDPISNLPVDSLGLIEWLLELETTFDCEFDIEVFEDNWSPDSTVRDIFDLIDRARV